MTGRFTQLWVGKTPDSKVPPRVRLRIFIREGGKCWISGRVIQPGEPWELDHKIALINGGRHAEDNLFPALVDKHKEKTKADVAEKAKVAKVAKKNIGTRSAPARPIKSAPFPQSTKRKSNPMPAPPRQGGIARQFVKAEA